MSLACWKQQHLIFTLGVGIPIFLIWVIGIPLVAFIHLWRHRKSLDEQVFADKYQALYEGL